MENLHFQGHLSIFAAEYTSTSLPLKPINNGQTFPKLREKNFDKVSKMTTLCAVPQNCQNINGNCGQKGLIFGDIFLIYEFLYCLLICTKSLSPIAKDIKKIKSLDKR